MHLTIVSEVVGSQTLAGASACGYCFETRTSGHDVVDRTAGSAGGLAGDSLVEPGEGAATRGPVWRQSSRTGLFPLVGMYLWRVSPDSSTDGLVQACWR